MANRGSDLRYDLEITLEEAATGRTVDIEFPRLVKCPDCKGEGSLASGFWSQTTCKACAGTRRIEQKQKIAAKIPAGVETGSRLRIIGMGGEGVTNRDVAGDLYVVIHVAEHDEFQRSGANLYTKASITSEQLVTGGIVTFPTLIDGPNRLRAPPGVGIDQKFRIRGRGMPVLGEDKRGDLFVTLVLADESLTALPREEPPSQTSTDVETPKRSAAGGMRWTPYGDSPRRLRVFLCHSSADKPAVRALFKKLISAGLEPWLDEEKLLPGQRWRDAIPRAVKDSDLVIICLSKESINKAGYVQREVKYALDAALEQPENSIFLIPLRLESCEVPESLTDWQWVDYFEDYGYERLSMALSYRAEALGVSIRPIADHESVRPGSVQTERDRTAEYVQEEFPVRVSTSVDERGDKILPHAIGIETLGGVFTKIIPEGTVLPHKLSEIFSTATDNQGSVEVHVLAGLRPLAQQNLSLGKFHLVGIPPAPRGMPQIEVTFEVDREGGLDVTARDLETGRNQRITITSPRGTSKEEIDRILREAKQYSEDDLRKREELDLRNSLDGLLYMTEKTLAENMEHFGASTKAEIDGAITEAKESLRAGEPDRISAAYAKLQSASQTMAKVLHERGKN